MDMRKNLLIGSGIIILMLIASVIFQPNVQVREDQGGNKYLPLSRTQAVLDYQWHDVYLTVEADSFNMYQILGHPSTTTTYAVYSEENPFGDIDQPFDLSAELRFHYLKEGKMIPQDTLNRRDYFNRKELFKDVTNFEGRRYLKDNEHASSWFEKIDDSIFIFILIALIPFLIMFLHDLILKLMKGQAFSNKYYGLQIVMITLTLLFFFNMVTPVSYAADNITALIKYSLLFFPIYFIYQYLLKGILKDEQAWKKAVIFFALCIVCSFGSTMIARLIDQHVFGSDGYTMLATRPIYFELGFLFSFTLGNFLNNLRKNYFKHRRRSKQLDSTKDKALASEAELNAIQASVNPHFLYNSLNAIASLAKKDPEKTQSMAFALSNFYKYQTNRNGEPLTTMQEEMEMLDNYLAIEKIRFGDRLNYQLEIDEVSKTRKIPHFLLQPLLENAVKYGYNSDSEKIDILLSVSSTRQHLNINIYDQGNTFDENLDSGYGLKSVIKKLQLFYPNGHSIDFINSPKKHVAIQIQV